MTTQCGRPVSWQDRPLWRAQAGDRGRHAWQTRGPRKNRAGYSLAEVAISSLLIGVLLVACLQATGQSLWFQNQQSLQQIGCVLGESLLAEVLSQAYSRPADVPAPTGREDFKFIDDYHEYSESPLVDRDGKPLAGMDGWERSVRITHANLLNPNEDAAQETGLKRVTVSVRYQDRLLYTAVGIRGRAP